MGTVSTTDPKKIFEYLWAALLSQPHALACIHLASILHRYLITWQSYSFWTKAHPHIKYIKFQLFALILFEISWSFRGSWWAGEGGRCLEKEGARDETRFFHQRRRQLLLGRSQHSDLVPLCSHLDSVKIGESAQHLRTFSTKSGAVGDVGDLAKDCGTPMNKIHPVTAHQFTEIFERVYFGPGRVDVVRVCTKRSS